MSLSEADMNIHNEMSTPYKSRFDEDDVPSILVSKVKQGSHVEYEKVCFEI